MKPEHEAKTRSVFKLFLTTVQSTCSRFVRGLAKTAEAEEREEYKVPALVSEKRPATAINVRPN